MEKPDHTRGHALRDDGKGPTDKVHIPETSEAIASSHVSGDDEHADNVASANHAHRIRRWYIVPA